ncbi:MAG: CpsD/CapB family tyrosine-protein kinase [Nitrospirota bacterium]
MKKHKTREDYKPNILFNFDLRSAFGAAFYNLLGKIYLLIKEHSLKTILITSATQGEGKSVVSSNLALGFAMVNEMKTVFIDTDLYHPRIHNIFNLIKSPGLSEILLDECPLDSALRKLDIKNLNIIPNGKSSTSTSMLLGSDKMGELITHLKGLFDIILIDSAPVMSSSDPLVLCPYVDGVILVIESEKTQREVIQRAKLSIESTQTKILGVVLNKKEYILPHYIYEKLYHYKGYYHYY